MSKMIWEINGHPEGCKCIYCAANVMMPPHDCQTPSTFLRRCGAVWCCRCGEMFTLGYAFTYDMFTTYRTRKTWVKVDKVRELARKP